MFCAKCGEQISNDSKFCPKCGNPVYSSGSQVQYQQAQYQMPVLNMARKKTTIQPVLLVLAVCLCVVIGGFVLTHGYFYYTPCEYCRSEPTRKYITSEDEAFYVCWDCSRTCSICGKHATKHYTNMLGMEIFVCRDCYKEIKKW